MSTFVNDTLGLLDCDANRDLQLDSLWIEDPMSSFAEKVPLRFPRNFPRSFCRSRLRFRSLLLSGEFAPNCELGLTEAPMQHDWWDARGTFTSRRWGEAAQKVHRKSRKGPF